VDGHYNSHKKSHTYHKRWLGFLGVFLMIIGIFLPIVKIPVIGNVHLFSHASEAAIILFIFAFISILTLIKGSFKLLWITGVACTITISATMYTTHSRIRAFQVKDDLEVGAADLVIHALASNCKWDIGLFTMSLGVVLLFAAAGLGGHTNITDNFSPKE
jgi:hypothetical protein